MSIDATLIWRMISSNTLTSFPWCQIAHLDWGGELLPWKLTSMLTRKRKVVRWSFGVRCGVLPFKRFCTLNAQIFFTLGIGTWCEITPHTLTLKTHYLHATSWGFLAWIHEALLLNGYSLFRHIKSNTWVSLFAVRKIWFWRFLYGQNG